VNGFVFVKILVVFDYQRIGFFFDVNAVVAVNAVAGVGVVVLGFGGLCGDVLYLFAGIQ